MQDYGSTALETYWGTGFQQVEGWVQSGLLGYLQHIQRLQQAHGITGEAGEIGVFHGKFLIALANLVGPSGKVTALDVFEDQSKNLDGAGAGDLDRMRANFATYAPKDVDLGIIKGDSTALTLADKVALVRDRGPFRLFSVDGCHTTEHTLADLQTAQECLAPGGVIILDDYMQPHWPGVTEAVHLFCRGVPRVAPFLYAHHKLFFVGLGWHAWFFQAFSEAWAHDPNARKSRMFGSDVLAVYP